MAAQREWLEKDYYRVLGVSDTASQKDIKSEYRKLGPMGGMFGGAGAAGGPGAGGFRVDDIGDLGDVLGGLFGRRRNRAGGAGAGTGPHRGQDLEAELHLAFEDAVHGLTTTIHLTSEAACSTCHGTGAKPGTTPQTCPRCGGRGVLDDNQGFFSFSSPCPQCAGRGYTIDEPCPTCRGTGVEHRPREVKVRIPAGVDDGQRIRLRGRGGPGRSGGRAGDLYVTVRVAPHELFGRKGSDLTLTVPITFPEAALGANVAVPTLDGGPVKVRIPAGTRSGRTFRVRGKGLEGRRKTGDLLVTVEVAVPQKLSADERKAIEALAAAADGRSPRAHLGAEGGP